MIEVCSFRSINAFPGAKRSSPCKRIAILPGAANGVRVHLVLAAEPCNGCQLQNNDWCGHLVKLAGTKKVCPLNTRR
jgi:hypothetical protein